MKGNDSTSVLIVDDDADIRANIQDILDDLGFQTDTAADGPSAIELVRQRPFDIALLDYRMPGMDGATLYREVKRLRSEMAAIMITAYAGSTGAQDATDAGAWHVLHKPVDVAQLLSVLDVVRRTPLVLLVDDDHEFCQTLWQLLREQNCRVAIATSEREGIEKANDLQYDVALIDLLLGGGDGRVVLDQIRKINPHTKSVLVTGDREMAAELIREGAVGSACIKPLAIDELLRTIGVSTTS